LIGNVVARRYASALYAIGKEQGMQELKAYGQGLSDLSAVLEASPELLKVFRNPIFTAEEKKSIAAKILDKAAAKPMLRNFVNLLADKDRLTILPDIEAHFRGMLDADEGLLRGRLVTAIELSADKRQALVGKMEKQTGKKLVLDYEVDPGIMGGLMLKVGDRVLDASLRAQLGMLHEIIKRGE